jgi:hypothetical protein
MKSTKKTHSNNPVVLKFVELTDLFEAKAEQLIGSTLHLSIEDKNEIAQELEGTIQNIKFMIKFFSSLK